MRVSAPPSRLHDRRGFNSRRLCFDSLANELSKFSDPRAPTFGTPSILVGVLLQDPPNGIIVHDTCRVDLGLVVAIQTCAALDEPLLGRHHVSY